ncbi:metalloregulator ArsR/SmtB family transcription factor [Nonomuraea sp. NPDC005650]|uniref:ArsR/SmtB family transcription factor n=1 Tax=Nonomuraea sp. NPDC005650 TaxID=3157045 RepID=UPI0033B1271B
MPVPLCKAKADFLRTLGHPLRVQVLELLQDGPLSVRDMLAVIEVDSSSLSQQLAVLRRAGIVTATREGATVVYALSSADVAGLLEAVRRILTDVIAGRSQLLDQLRDAGAAHPRPG